MHQYLSQLDYKIFTSLNNWSANHTAFAVFSFFADKLVYIMVLLLIAYWFAGKPREKARAAIITAAAAFIISRGILAELIRHIWTRNRPFVAHTVANVYDRVSGEASFPSGHASAMFAIALAVYFYNKKWGTWLLALSVVTGFSRVVVGEHYPSDIIGGTILGLAVAYLVFKYLAPKMAVFTRKASALSDRLIPFTKQQ